MTRVAVVVGGSGFVGHAVATELCSGGWSVKHLGRAELDRAKPAEFVAPTASDPAVFARKVTDQLVDAPLDELAEVLSGADVVVNAAGAATPLAAMSNSLAWANVAVPFLLSESCGPGTLFIHVSSAAVQGALDLDESDAYDCATPYSLTKAAGEEVVLHPPAESQVIVYRPTSVHGESRQLTRDLRRVLGFRILPRVVGNSVSLTVTSVASVARGIAFLADIAEELPSANRIFLHPPSGITQADLVEHTESWLLPVPARLVSALLNLVTRLPGSRLRGVERRARAALLGQQNFAQNLIAAGFRTQLPADLVRETGIFLSDNEAVTASPEPERRG